MWKCTSGLPVRSAHCHRFPSGVAVLPLVLHATLALCAISQPAMAQTKVKPVIEDRDLVAEDGMKLKITYFKSMSGKDAAVVVLLHGKQGTRQNWKGLATQLQQNGDFAVVAVDLRGHGESLNPGNKKVESKKVDYQNMVEFDMKAVKDFVFDEHQKGHLNMNRLGIVACDFSASVAALYTELDWEKAPFDDSPSEADRTPRGRDVQALVLISPEMNAPGLVTANAVKILRGLKRPVMIGVSEKNNRDSAAASKLFEQLSPKKDRDKDKEKEEHVMLLQYEGNLPGSDLVAQNSKVRDHIVFFLNRHLKEQLQSDWRDRRSRIDRE